MINSMYLVFPSVGLQSTSEQWHTIIGVFSDLLLRTDSAEQENADRLDTLKYKALLSNKDLEGHISSLEDIQATTR